MQQASIQQAPVQPAPPQEASNAVAQRPAMTEPTKPAEPATLAAPTKPAELIKQAAPAKAAALAKPAAPTKAAMEHNQRGRELLNQHMYAEAIDELNAALEQSPVFAQALNARGFAYLLLRDWPKALKDLDEAIRIDPSYTNAYVNRVVARKGAGDPAGAEADQAKVRELTAKK